MLKSCSPVFIRNQSCQRQLHGVSEAKAEKEDMEKSQPGSGLTSQGPPPRMSRNKKADCLYATRPWKRAAERAGTAAPEANLVLIETWENPSHTPAIMRVD